jgi:hypothetical protein
VTPFPIMAGWEQKGLHGKQKCNDDKQKEIQINVGNPPKMELTVFGIDRAIRRIDDS